MSDISFGYLFKLLRAVWGNKFMGFAMNRSEAYLLKSVSAV